ncbi:beta-1 adrenergic receptor [Nematostella vectensis]|uniref:beta-1 adrenergic receptor n=1 Tax=Nematostella vectensis TaxID=45351 RepID=UPI00207773A5|nr:beta-1 adrenergic receptor [Nematostella vectensis]
MDNTTDTVPPKSSIFHVCYLCFLILAIIIGNSLVLVLIRLNRRLHSPTFYFLGNLSFAELLIGVGFVPLYTAAVLEGRWRFGKTMCRAHAFVVTSSVNASLITLCVVSVDRFLDIRDPLRYFGRMTKRRSAMIIFCIWAHSLFWAAMPLVDWGEISFDNNTKTCRPDFAASGISNRVYAALLVVFGFAIPSLVTGYCHIKIYQMAKEQTRKIAKISVRKDFTSGHVQEDIVLTFHPRRERKAHKTILIIIGAFVVCWLPYSIGTSWKLATGHALELYWFANVGLTLALTNSSLNPLIYTLRDRRVRMGFMKLVCGERYRKKLSGKFLAVEL